MQGKKEVLSKIYWRKQDKSQGRSWCSSPAFHLLKTGLFLIFPVNNSIWVIDSPVGFDIM
jgi:hypothetical protein